jgi:hypothetical protein
MRIKSYFAPSVQSAISLARKEFGDEVTLVTSHAAPLESRHLGDYEVVFAVDEPVVDAEPVKPAQVIKAAAPETPRFEELLQQAIVTPLSTEEDLESKLDRVRTILLEMGIDAPMTRALMTMIERSVALPLPAGAETPELEAETAAIADAEVVSTEEAEPEPVVCAPVPDLTPAELAFYLSVSVGS